MAGALGQARRHNGFTLIELMIALVVMAILATIAVPSYWRFVERANRADATAELLRLAAAQERFYIANNTYTANLAVPPAGLGGGGASERGYYAITVTAADANGFTIQAVPAAGSKQTNDDECQVFTINEQGTRTAGPGTVEDCWR
jgi:type IV pilus assembly protein PilE